MTKLLPLIEESSYAKVMQILFAQIPAIKQIGIITAFNPGSTPLPIADNNKRNQALKHRIRELRYHYIQLEESAFEGSFEKPFLILNIPKKDLARLSKEFGQDSVIHGHLVKTISDKKAAFLFEFISTKEELPITEDSTTVVLTKDKGEIFTKVKGRKFYIPFFSNNRKDIEILDEHVISIHSINEVKLTKQTKEIIHTIERCVDNLLLENKTAKHYWHNRSCLDFTLGKLKKLIV